MKMKRALEQIVKLIEYWAENPRVRHEEVLRQILDTALLALKRK